MCQKCQENRLFQEPFKKQYQNIKVRTRVQDGILA
nr:MAG TPA: hypothetical protein [Caudoviricetes sp.]